MTADTSDREKYRRRLQDKVDIFQDQAMRLNNQLYDLQPGSREHHNTLFERDIAAAQLRQCQQELLDFELDQDERKLEHLGLVRGRNVGAEREIAVRSASEADRTADEPIENDLERSRYER